MAKYREHFRLSPADVELIEQAIRTEISLCARVAHDDSDFERARRRTRALNEVLGKLHNQKIFYAHVNETEAPAA